MILKILIGIGCILLMLIIDFNSCIFASFLFSMVGGVLGAVILGIINDIKNGKPTL